MLFHKIINFFFQNHNVLHVSSISLNQCKPCSNTEVKPFQLQQGPRWGRGTGLKIIVTEKKCF